MKPKLLLVEDEKHLAFQLVLNLEAEGFTVIHCASGDEVLPAYHAHKDLSGIILDVMLPGVDGFSIAKSIREINAKIGIIMLTARANDEDRIHGLAIGADDYITKPFRLEEFLMRVRRMAKRADFIQELSDTIVHGELTLDYQNLLLCKGKEEFSLTKIEADLLAEFFRSPGKVLTREYLLEKVWGMSGDVATRTVDNFISRIRKMIEVDGANPKSIISVRGCGYKFAKPEESDSVESSF